MRQGGAIALALLGILLAAGPITADQDSAPVSPGSPQEMLEIGQRCPTFTWTAADKGGAYELAVYRLGEDGTPDNAEETLRLTLPPGSTAWTPSAASCLESGERYAWTVRALGKTSAGEWAAPSLFSVTISPTLDEMDRLLAELRERSASDARDSSGEGRESATSGTVSHVTNTGGNYFNGSVQVNGKFCAGHDCTDGEVVNYGSMKINADAASLVFEDSSTLTGYPSNDWRIVINDTDQGGEDYFAIQDLQTGFVPLRIEAGAGDDSFQIADSSAGFGGDILAPHGEVTTEGVNLASSREWKRDFEPVNGEDVLARLGAVSISTWSFHDEPEVRHIGPVSEEFHAAFALPGHDPQHLAVTDVNGVALAAIQALAARSAEQRLAIEKLRRQNEELERLLLSLIGREFAARRWR